jgi:hypothetical protein
MSRTRQISIAAAVALLILMVDSGGHSAAANAPPVAEAGLLRYAAQDRVQLDGRESSDPDRSGPLTYAWTQVSGPPLVISGATTATPTLSGFVQTPQIQECQLQLIVNDGQQASSPDTVKVVIVPDFGPSTLNLESGLFDAKKPTVISFGGAADGINGLPGQPGGTAAFFGAAWVNAANIIGFPSGYTPDSGTAQRTYYKYGDMIIAYLSAVAPDYRQAIQVIGMSSGIDPALDVGIRLNETYRDARYAVNRVTELDGLVRIVEGGSSLTPPVIVSRAIAGTLTRADVNLAAGWKALLEHAQRFLDSSVDGEQCWMDFSYGTLSSFLYDPPSRSNILWVRTALSHANVFYWYRDSLTGTDTNQFNSGVVGGAYWSVVGPGKNLQLASMPGVYCFQWDGNAQNGAMGFFDQSAYPGRLPEPVTLLDLHDPSFPEDDPNGVILTCKESQNAVGYQLLSGSDPYDVAHYTIVADSNSPPAVSVAKLPSSDAWWTVKARDAYGSTIHADPVRVGLPVGVIAYWKLDEVEGNSAADSAAHHDGILHGNALWQPSGGKKTGALAFDGIDAQVSTDFVLNPSDGPFSVFAWVKGAAPGKVILSQAGGVNWLMAAANGAFTTELKQTGRQGKPLTSLAVITDGTWHRVGFVWDGTNRIFYVDDIEVGTDTQTSLVGSTGGLCIGASSTLAPGSFWSGLIDDVRIYDRAVKP